MPLLSLVLFSVQPATAQPPKPARSIRFERADPLSVYRGEAVRSAVGLPGRAKGESAVRNRPRLLVVIDPTQFSGLGVHELRHATTAKGGPWIARDKPNCRS
jgi:hypothetical protein